MVDCPVVDGAEKAEEEEEEEEEGEEGGGLKGERRKVSRSGIRTKRDRGVLTENSRHWSGEAMVAAW